MSPNVLNDALPDGGGLFTVVVENERINKARADADFAAPVAPNVCNDALHAGGILSLGTVENIKKIKHELL